MAAGRAAAAGLRACAAGAGWRSGHVGQRVLVEHVDEGAERVVEDLVDAVVRACGLRPADPSSISTCVTSVARTTSPMRMSLGRTRQPHAAVAPAHRLDQPGARQQVDDLERRSAA